MKPRRIGVVVGLAMLAGCVVDSVCYNDADCPDTHLCDREPPAEHGECRKGCDHGADCVNPDRTCDSRPWINGEVCMQRCADDRACPTGWLCDAARCFRADCRQDHDCVGRLVCRGGFCVAGGGDAVAGDP